MGSRGMFYLAGLLTSMQKKRSQQPLCRSSCLTSLYCSTKKAPSEPLGTNWVDSSDRAKPKGNLHSCARIYMEVDLEKGLPEALQTIRTVGAISKFYTTSNSPSNATLLMSIGTLLKTTQRFKRISLLQINLRKP